MVHSRNAARYGQANRSVRGTSIGMDRAKRTEILLGVVLPIVIVGLILLADYFEGPKTAYVGVIAVVPMLAAVFASPALTLLVGVVAWLSAFTFGHLASDGNVTAQTVRLIIIAISTLIAIGAATLRQRRERALVEALQGAQTAEQMRQQAMTDSLTGLANRRGIIEQLTSVDPSVVRTVALIDCDNLKAVNDTHGHLAGDEFLKAVAGRIRSNLASQDLIARWGGDEFLVVQDLTIDQATNTLQRLCETVRAPAIHLGGTSVNGSVSVGAVAWLPGMSLDDALAGADTALYQAKYEGGNLVRFTA